MASCPRCDNPLIRDDATSCACGWRERGRRESKKDAPRPFVHCAHETCDIPAKCRVKTPTGWADFCEPHYVRFHDDQARKRCAEAGLLKRSDEGSGDYRKRMMAYVRENARLKRFTDASPMSEAERVGELV